MYKIIFEAYLNREDIYLAYLVGRLPLIDEPLNKPEGSIAILASELEGKTGAQLRTYIENVVQWSEECKKKAFTFIMD
jgi:hypothetical protein